ncbi:MAG: type II secretion system protein GspE, partial [Pseudomonadota bacterium]
METQALGAVEDTDLLPQIGSHLEDRAADLCTLMIDEGRLKPEDLNRATAYRDQHGGNLLTLLVRLGLVSERDLARAQSELLKIPLFSEKDYPEQGPEIDSIAVRFMKQQHLVPIKVHDDAVEIVMADPQDPVLIKALNMATGLQIQPRVGITSEIDNHIERYFGGGRS